MINKILNSIKNMIKRGFISTSVDDSMPYPICQVTYMSKAANAERVSPYGLYSNPPVETMALVFNVQGQEENLACLPYAQVTRFKNLNSGEVLIGNVSSGSYIKFKENGDIELFATGNIIALGQTLTLTSSSGALAIGGGKVNFTGIVNLGSESSPAIARVGDTVNVGGVNGTITTGGTNKSA